MKSRIVVVDDQAESRESAVAFLSAEGYDVSAVPDGEQVLQGFSTCLPSAILFQILDPANRVIDFVRRLALSRQAMSVPVVVVTALSAFQVGSFLDGVPGVRRIVHSPWSPETLRQAMAQALRYAKAN